MREPATDEERHTTMTHRPWSLVVVIAALGPLLALAACGDDRTTEIDTAPVASDGGTAADGDDGPPAVPDDLDGRTFIATSITEDGDAGCNQIGAIYRLEGARLGVDPMEMTAMDCDPERMVQDDHLGRILTGELDVALDGDELVLTGDGNTIDLTEREVVRPDQALVGPT